MTIKLNGNRKYLSNNIPAVFLPSDWRGGDLELKIETLVARIWSRLRLDQYGNHRPI